MKLPHVLDVELCYSFRVTGSVTGYEVFHLRQAIHNNQYSIEVLAGFQVSDKVH